MLLTEMAGLPGQFLDVFCPRKQPVHLKLTPGEKLPQHKENGLPIINNSNFQGLYVRSREYKTFPWLALVRRGNSLAPDHDRNETT